jgi:hypothetical protein
VNNQAAAMRAFFESIDIELVRAVFGEAWAITHAPAGWLALRRGGGVIHWDGPESLIVPVLFAERLGDLAQQLCVQSLLDQLNSEDLAKVYATGELPGDLFMSSPGSADD